MALCQRVISTDTGIYDACRYDAFLQTMVFMFDWRHARVLRVVRFIKPRSNGHNICLSQHLLRADVVTIWQPPLTNVERGCEMLRRVWIHLNFVSTSSQRLFCSWNVERLLRPFDRVWSQHDSTNVERMLRQMLRPFERALSGSEK